MELIELSRQPSHEIADELRAYEQKIEEETDFFNPARPLASLRNPIGDILYAASFPMISGVVRDKETLQSRLGILQFVLENPEPAPDVEPPLDNLTGKPYRLQFKNGEIQISSRVEDEDIDAEISYTVK